MPKGRKRATNMLDLRKQFVQFREISKKTQYGLMRDTGTQKLNDFEAGLRAPRLDTFIKWCNELSIEIKLIGPRRKPLTDAEKEAILETKDR